MQRDVRRIRLSSRTCRLPTIFQRTCRTSIRYRWYRELIMSKRPRRSRSVTASAASSPQRPAYCPPSATHALVGWSGLTTMVCAICALNFWAPTFDIAFQALIVMAAAAVGVFVPDLLWQQVQRRTLVAASPGDWPRSFTKLAGLVGAERSSPHHYSGPQVSCCCRRARAATATLSNTSMDELPPDCCCTRSVLWRGYLRSRGCRLASFTDSRH
jgi:hypothetical protein